MNKKSRAERKRKAAAVLAIIVIFAMVLGLAAPFMGALYL